MKKIFVLFLILPALLFATPVDPTLAQQIAENFINVSESSNTNARKMHRKLKRIVSRSMSVENQQYYIFNSEDSCGFVIVSADNCATPILGYSTEGYIDINNLPIQLKDLLQAYNDEIQYAVDNNLQATDSIKDLWNTYQNSPQSRKATAVVSELISTKWSQSPLYNDKCPVDATLSPLGGHPTTGCVATAMAQIMKYWEYPVNGVGNKSYKSNHYGTLSANFANTTYDWANMPVKLSTSSSSAQIDAVATLMYHCGVAVEMNYNSDGQGSSGASTLDPGGGRASAETALKTYFGYASSLQGKSWSSSTSLATWKKMLKEELDNKRPMLYRGTSANGGHCFICDGYDSNDKFHFNWGWGGSANGYFSLTALTPSSHNYSDGQKAIIGIQPANGSTTPKNYALYMNTDLTATSTSSSNSYTFGKAMAFTAKVENNGTGTFNGSFRVAIFTNSGEFMAWSKESYHFALQANHKTVLETYTFDGGIPFIPGKYRAYMYYLDDNESTWHLVKSDVGIFLTEYNNVAFSIKSYSDLQPVSDFYLAFGDFIVGSKIRIEVDVRNTALLTTFYGKIRLCLYDQNGDRAQILDYLDFSNGFSYRTTKTLSFTSIVDVEPGTYYLALTFNESGKTSWYYMGCSSTYINPIEVIVRAPTLYADNFEKNNTQSSASLLNWSIVSETEDFGTSLVSLHDDYDVDYYKLEFPEANKYKVQVSLYDKYNPSSWYYVNADAQFSYSLGGATYSTSNKNSKTISFNGPTTLYLKVTQYDSNGLGFYELSGEISETKLSGVDEIRDDDTSATKFIKDGQLYILRDGNTYNISGTKTNNH